MKQVKGIDNKKEMERAELHRTIWGIANDLRRSVDGWDFKQYEYYRDRLLSFNQEAHP